MSTRKFDSLLLLCFAEIGRRSFFNAAPPLELILNSMYVRVDTIYAISRPFADGCKQTEKCVQGCVCKVYVAHVIVVVFPLVRILSLYFESSS